MLKTFAQRKEPSRRYAPVADSTAVLAYSFSQGRADFVPSADYLGSALNRPRVSGSQRDKRWLSVSLTPGGERYTEQRKLGLSLTPTPAEYSSNKHTEQQPCRVGLKHLSRPVITAIGQKLIGSSRTAEADATKDGDFYLIDGRVLALV